MKKVAVVKKSDVDALESYLVLKDALAKCESLYIAFCDGLEDIPADADKVLAFGGDGMMLAVARYLAEQKFDAAILGVNLGHMGFLTAFESDVTAEKLIGALLSDDVIERPLLEAFAPSHVGYALNDVVVKAEGSRPMRLELYVDGNLVDCYQGDGLIVSTAAGSTAYSLSAGGPVLAPTLNAIEIIPICAHTLHARPIVVSDDCLVEIRPIGRYGAHVYLDGDQCLLIGANGGALRIAKAARGARFADVKANFFKKLSDKMNG